MRVPRKSYSALAALALAAACGAGSGATAPPRAAASAASPQQTGAQATVVDLRQRLLAFADMAMTEMARATEAVRSTDPDPEARAYARGVQASVAATSLALAVEPDAEAALTDLMVSISAQRGSVEERGPTLLAPAAAAELVESLGALEREIWSVGEEAYPPAELSALRVRLDRWRKESPRQPAGGVVRVADLPEEGPALSKGLFAPLNEATRQVEETRLLGERFLFLAQRLPTVTLWHTEALTWELMASPEARQALGDLTGLSETLAGLSATVDSLPATLDDQRESMLAAFDAREETMHGLLADAGAVITEARTLAESGERLAGLSNDAADRLERVLHSADGLLAALRDPEAPGGAVSLNVASYTAALADFRGAAEALSSALAQAEGVQSAPEAWIDHAFWRAVQLMLLGFVLLVAYRFVPGLLGKRSA